MANILVVDDEPGIREFLVETLATDGHHLTEAASGDAAVQRLNEEEFDLLITDLRMPGKLDGMDVVREARKSHPHTRVIVLTAHGSVATAVDAMKIGAIDFLEKPMSGPTELRILVSRALADSQDSQDDNIVGRHRVSRQAARAARSAPTIAWMISSARVDMRRCLACTIFDSIADSPRRRYFPISPHSRTQPNDFGARRERWRSSRTRTSCRCSSSGARERCRSS